MPQPPLGELAALPDPLAAFKGPILVKEGRGGRTGGKGKGRKRRAEGRGREPAKRGKNHTGIFPLHFEL